MFLGSPCTIGSGKIVGIDRREQIRQLKDLSQNNAPHYIPAKQFYHDIERRLISRGYTLDLFVSSLDQVGVLEMNTCCSSTGGIIVYSDSYSESRFKDSFVRYFENIMFDADIQVHHTSGIKVTDMIGHGITNNIWRSNSISPNTSVAIYFDVDSTTPKQYVQYVSRWRTVDEYRTRVTTHEFIFSNDLEILTSGFDQEAAAVLVVRKTLKTIETQSPQEALCQLDQSIIQITKIFGTMSTNRLQLPNNIVLFPQFMYHFRKTQFLKVLNEEADYLACTRFFINREPTDTCMLLIQPQLTQYDMYGPPHAIALDGSSIRNDAIIMIDSFFVIIINYGNTVVAWRNQDYHHKPGYALFKEFVVSPIEEAKKRIKNRFPCPKLVKRNAQRIYWSASVCTATDFDILPNDGSFKDFMNCLQKIVFKVL
jgi:protein transport protein SEC23